jgi:glycosyltransferase involved in cell wall biosynthesis
MMRILIVHNRYQQPGGEDLVVKAEIGLLRSKGIHVELLEENNDGIVRWIDAASTALESVYSLPAARDARRRIDSFRPDVVHVHNFFPRLSPSIHYVCHEKKVPVVQSLHNYRLLCPAATFMRDGSVCEDCLGKTVPWPAMKNSCYHSSKLATAAVANMLAVHRGLHTWSRKVTRFIALTEFARNKFIAGGLPGNRMTVKPNFVALDHGMGAGEGGYALFVGRLSEEKGLGTLLEAWKKVRGRGRLKILGDGPMAPMVREAASTVAGIEWLGPRSRDEVSLLMANAAFLVFPSICYETFGLSIIEALSVGLPVIASNLGAMAELVTDGSTGKLFPAGSSEDLAAAIDWALANPDALKSMRLHARREFELKYTAESNYVQLMGIYQAALVADPGRHHLKSYALQN